MCFYSNKMLPHSSHVEKFPSLLDFVLWFFSCFSPKGAMAAGGVSVGRHGFFVTAKFGKSCSHSRALSPRQDASESPRRKHTCSWKCWPKRDLKHPFTTWVFCCYCIERVYQFPINKQEHGVKMVRYNLIASNRLKFTIQTTNGAHLQNSSGEFPAKIQIYIYIYCCICMICIIHMSEDFIPFANPTRIQPSWFEIHGPEGRRERAVSILTVVAGRRPSVKSINSCFDLFP